MAPLVRSVFVVLACAALLTKTGGLHHHQIAILFLCDIDNITFKLALSERVRARVEDAGRVELGDAEAAALVRMKAIHVSLIVVCVLSGVWAADGLPYRYILVFFLGGVAEACAPGNAMQLAERAKRVGAAVAAALAGFVGWVLMLVLAQLGTAKG
eukprot:SAG22_NODE_2280_length_2761_cov_3.172802_2_plen_156_part_00